ncbi:MAG: 3'-5' exonuclease [Acidimicrobiia bacterium]
MIRPGRRRGIARRPWAEIDCWALDLEMSGLDPATGRIIAVGMVPVRDRVIRAGEGFATLVRADGPLDMSGVAAHHLLPDQLAAAPPLDEVVAEIDRHLAGSVLVVHAAEIDLPYLRRAYRNAGRSWPDPPVIDTLRLVRRHERHRLAVEPVEAAIPGVLAAARAELGLPSHEAHDAFADAVGTAELLLVLAHRLGARTVGDLL